MSITWEKLQSQYAAALDEACEINDYYDAAAADEACAIYDAWMEAYPNRRVWWRKMEKDLHDPEAYAKALQDAMADNMPLAELEKIKSQIQGDKLLRNYDAPECVEDEISIEDNEISIVFNGHVYDFSLGEFQPDKEWICLSPELTQKIMTQKVRDFLNATKLLETMIS